MKSWAPGNHWYCYSTAKRLPGTKVSGWTDHWVRYGSPPPKVGPNTELWFCPHPFREKRRISANAVPVPWLWADLDSADPRLITPRPTVAWETSPGRYAALWKLTTAVSPDRWRALLRGMTYAVGADRGGWDLTQVLRVPGSRNWKYPSAPHGRLLWDKGSIYRPSDLPEKNDEVSIPDSTDVLQRCEPLLKPRTRKILLAKAATGDRSTVLWQLENLLLDDGVPVADAKILCQGSVWNKFANRPAEFDREFNKILASRVKPTKTVVDPRTIRPISALSVRRTQWLVKGYIPKRHLTLFEGDPGVGKTFALLDLCAAVTRRGMWIDRPVETGNVLYFSYEDDAEETILPRLIHMGADTKRFFLCAEHITFGDEGLERVQEYIDQVHPTLIVFDTLMNYFGDSDMFRANEVASVLDTFTTMASENDAAVLGVRHLTKGNKGAALYRGQGSMNFVGRARSVIGIAFHPEDDEEDDRRRVMSVTKGNLIKRYKSQMYTLQECPTDDQLARVVWEGESDLTSDETFGEVRKDKKQNAKLDLSKILSKEWTPITKLITIASTRNISERTLQRALSEMLEKGEIEHRGGVGRRPSEYRQK